MRQKSKHDIIDIFKNATIQHGPFSNRIYLMKADGVEAGELASELIKFAQENEYTKIFAKLPRDKSQQFIQQGYAEEAVIPNFFDGKDEAVFLGYFLDNQRAIALNQKIIETTLDLALKKMKKGATPVKPLPDGFTMRICMPDDIPDMVHVYKKVFATYPFPIHDAGYLAGIMEKYVVFFGIWKGDTLVALASSEMDTDHKNAEMTDFATLPEYRGYGFALYLLRSMETEMCRRGIKTLYTIARAVSPGMNITFAKNGYTYSGTLINNTNISGSIESMNVWYKHIDDL